MICFKYSPDTANVPPQGSYVTLTSSPEPSPTKPNTYINLRDNQGDLERDERYAYGGMDPLREESGEESDEEYFDYVITDPMLMEGSAVAVGR